MRPFSLSIALALLLLTAAPIALAESGSASGATAGSGTNVWEVRAKRAQGFGEQWSSFAPVFASWIGKWEKSSAKQSALFSRCAMDVRSANRDTLLPVTLQCYKGQILIEQESLKREREIVVQWPGLPEAAKTDHLQKIDALLGALTPVLAGIDVKVFTTMTAFKDVRRNLLTQYRQPYWLSAAHVRAQAVHTWLAHLLLSIQPLSIDTTLPSASLQKLQEALICYGSAEAILEETANATTIPTAHVSFSQALAQLAGCPALLQDAENLQKQSSSVPSVR